MASHHPDRALYLGPDYNQGSSATWSLSPAGKAVVFIHGYGGNALTTWSEFNKQLPNTPGFEGYDFIFYGHDGLRATTHSSAALFYSFLDRLFTQPLAVCNPNLATVSARPNTFAYSKVILAAHSLGAVICRYALLYAREKKCDWMNKTSMILYAPAHKGARVAKLARELGIGGGTFAAIVRMIVGGISFASPLIDELDDNSAVLKTLLTKTEAALDQGDSDYLIARNVIIAERERIVTNLSFAKDPPPITFAQTSHTSVCKPRPSFLEPLVPLLREATRP